MANPTVKSKEAKGGQPKKFGVKGKLNSDVPGKLEAFIQEGTRFFSVAENPTVNRSVKADTPFTQQPFVMPEAVRRKTEEARKFLEKNPIPENYLN